MDHVEISEEMRSRVLRNLSQELSAPMKKSKIIKFPGWKQAAAAAAVFVIFAAGTLTYNNILHTANPQQGTELVTYGTTEYSSLSELEEAVGFSVEQIGNIPFDVAKTEYTSYTDHLAEIIYTGDTNRLTYRKSQGSEDNSGIFTAYEKETDIRVKDKQIQLKGSGEGFELAIWTEGGSSYSLSFDSPIAMSEWKKMLDSIAFAERS